MEIKDIFVPSATAVLGAILVWLRFKKRDTAEANKTNAEAKKAIAEADTTLADGFRKLMAIQEAELFKKIQQLEEQEKVLRVIKDDLKRAEMAFIERESMYQKMIVQLNERIHKLEADIKKSKQ